MTGMARLADLPISRNNHYTPARRNRLPEGGCVAMHRKHLSRAPWQALRQFVAGRE